MADTLTTTIEETFGLIAAGRKVKLWTEAELLPLIWMEASCGRSVGKTAEHTAADVESRYGAAGARLYRKALNLGLVPEPR